MNNSTEPDANTKPETFQRPAPITKADIVSKTIPAQYPDHQLARANLYIGHVQTYKEDASDPVDHEKECRKVIIQRLYGGVREKGRNLRRALIVRYYNRILSPEVFDEFSKLIDEIETYGSELV